MNLVQVLQEVPPAGGLTEDSLEAQVGKGDVIKNAPGSNAPKVVREAGRETGRRRADPDQC